jgi:dihydrofolate reductase
MKERKVILYISMSLDGFIATNEDDLSWLSIVEAENEDYGYADFLNTVDTYIVGRKTYEIILQFTDNVFPHADRFKCYVMTSQTKAPEKGVNFYNGDIEQLIVQLKKEEGKNIYCDGGAEVVRLLLNKELIDEYIISVIPIMLGDGKRLFKGKTPMQKLRLISSKKYDSGLVQLHYQTNKK